MTRAKAPAAVILVLLVAAGCGQASPAPSAPSAGAPASSPSRAPAAPAPDPSRAPGATADPTPTPTPGPSEAFTRLPNGVSYVDLDARWTFLGAGDDAIWLVAQRSGGRDILRIDPETLEITPVVRGEPTLRDPSHGMALNGSIWVGEYGLGRVRRYDAATGRDLGALEVGPNPYFAVPAFDDLWVPLHEGGAIARVDTATGSVEATIDVARKGPAGPLLVDSGGGLIWEAAPNTPRVVAIDPATNRVVREFPLDESCRPGSASWFRDRVFVGGCSEGQDLILDPQTGGELGRTATHVPVGHERLEVGDRVWVVAPSATDEDYAIAAVDADTLVIVDTFRTGLAITDWYYTGAFDAYWVSSGAQGRIIQIPRSALPAD